MAYIQDSQSDDHACVFCTLQAVEDGDKNLIIYRGQHAYVILNRYPYTSGHLMVVPNVHQPDLERLDSQVRAEMMELTSRFTQVLQKAYNPQGFNIGINIGEAAGAGIVGHIHMHIVPRWLGDTNFMSSLGTTRVVPESLQDTYLRIKNAMDKDLA